MRTAKPSKVQRRAYVVNGLVCFVLETRKVVLIASYRGLVYELGHRLATRKVQIEMYKRQQPGAPETFLGYMGGELYERMVGCFDRAFSTIPQVTGIDVR